MATVLFYQQADMNNSSVWYGTVTVANSTTLSITDYHGRTGTYHGYGFTYSGSSVTGGTVTGYDSYVNYSLAATVSGTSSPATDVAWYVNSGNEKGLQWYILSGNDYIYGSSYNDVLLAYGGNDVIQGGAGNDWIDGGDGVNVSLYTGASNSYKITINGTPQISVADTSVGRDGTDTLTNIQNIQFSDQTLQSKWFNESWLLARTNPSEFTTLTEMYLAYFNRAPDAVGLDYWASCVYEGQTNTQVANTFSTTPEAINTYGTITAQSSPAAIGNFVNAVYLNVLNRSPDAGGSAYWISQIQSGKVTPGSFILAIIDAVNGQTGTADKIYLTSKETVGAHFAVVDGLTNTTQANNVMQTFNSTYMATGATAAINAANAMSDSYLSHVAITPELVVQLVGVNV